MIRKDRFVYGAADEIKVLHAPDDAALAALGALPIPEPVKSGRGDPALPDPAESDTMTTK